MPSISALIPFRDRIEEFPDKRVHCRPVLAECCKRLIAGGVDEIVIGNVGPRSVLPMDGPIREVHVSQQRWNTCIPRNMAAMVSKGDVLLFTLADNPLVTVHLLKDFCDVPEGVIRTAERDCDVVGQDAIAAMNGADPSTFKKPQWFEAGFHLGRFMAIRRRDFFDKVRGWDWEMFDWGYNDRDFIARCKRVGIKQMVYPGFTSVHIDHPRLTRVHCLHNEAMSKSKLERNWWAYE